jgi:2-hydroxycyclohexanecarboxyl-CoA dehydrogenase
MSNGNEAMGTAIVTGAARGVGAEIARLLAGNGTRVGLIDLDGAAAEVTASRIREQGGSVLAASADVGDYAALKAAFDRVSSDFGPIDLLVNNAGWSPNKRFVDMTELEWDKVIAINYRGVINGCRAVIEQMQERGSGRIVSIASDAGRVGTPKESVYAGAKAAVIGFSKSLAAEVARQGITVNVVSPGTTDTPLLREMLSDEQMQRRIKANPMGRIGTPADIAAAVLFFASNDASYVTGQVLSVNGGMTRLG